MDVGRQAVNKTLQPLPESRRRGVPRSIDRREHLPVEEHEHAGPLEGIAGNLDIIAHDMHLRRRPFHHFLDFLRQSRFQRGNAQGTLGLLLEDRPPGELLLQGRSSPEGEKEEEDGHRGDSE